MPSNRMLRSEVASMNVVNNLPPDLEQPVDAPALSVVLVCGSGYEVLRRTVEHLRRQSMASDLELLCLPNRSGYAFPMTWPRTSIASA